jgi:hypothetical protein
MSQKPGGGGFGDRGHGFKRRDLHDLLTFGAFRRNFVIILIVWDYHKDMAFWQVEGIY